MRIIPASVTTIVLVAALSSCGAQGPDSGYCKDLKASRSDLESSQTSGLAGLGKQITTIHRLADSAPDEVAGDWKKLDAATLSIDRALSKAGLKASDLANIQKGKIPSGVTQSDLQAVAKAFAGMSKPRLAEASTKIRKNANDVCHVPLGEF